jgi:hypothetical protein
MAMSKAAGTDGGKLAAALVGRIVQRADELGITEGELAQRARMPAETLSRLKNADGANLRNIHKLAQVVGLRVDLVPDDDYLARLRGGSLLNLG